MDEALEGEISFADAMGASEAPTSTPSISVPTGEISFADAAGPAATPRTPLTKIVSSTLSEGMERRNLAEDASRRMRETSFNTAVGIDLESDPSQGFATHAGKTALRGIRALVTAPVRSAVGGVKALTSGVIGLGESAIAGVRGLGEGAGAALIKGTVGQLPMNRTTAPMAGTIRAAAGADPLATAVSTIEGSMQQTAQMREIAKQLTKINLVPENEQEEAMEDLLMLMPEGITAGGDTVYEKTGSALAGAGTQGLLTLLTMKPTIVGKVVQSVKSKSLFTTTFDALAKTEPESAKALIDHIAQEAPPAAKKLKVRLKAVAKRPAAKLGEEAVAAELKTRDITPEEAGMQVSKAVEEMPQEVPVADPIAKETAVGSEVVKTPEQIFASGPTLDALPGGQFVKGKLTAWWDEIVRNFAPESLGPQAKMSAAVVANRIAESMNKDAANHGFARERLKFWMNQPVEAVREFMKTFESGGPHKDPVLQSAADNMRQRNREIFAQDQKTGIKYDPVDNYLYHVFEDGAKVAAHFEAKYGAKWGDPGFTKDRTFDFYEEAIAAGFKPKFTNPEEIMLMRQHASDVAQMKAEILRDLEEHGLAQKKTKDSPDPPKGGSYNYRRSPTGEGYWIDATADVILHNAFDTKSLWAMQGIAGDTFRGAMFLKNAIVPIKLALSLFHPLHVATIDNATGMVRASKALLSGALSPVAWLGQMLEAGLYGSKGIPLKGVWDTPRLGSRILRAYQGKIDPAKLTAADTLSLQYMAEGGMIPEMSVQYRTNALANFTNSIRQMRAEYAGAGGLGRATGQAAKSAWYLPFALIEALQKPMFQIWIPSLKIASYLKDVQTALKVDPRLVADKGSRLLALRKIAKSVDNRYGEMAYNTLFWNRMIKDIAVANTLSLGWNLGFIREYGGGLLDINQAAFTKGSVTQKAKSGLLDRPLFVSFYTIQSLMYGGLLTWAFTGQTPSDLIDYIYPKNGNKTPSGDDERMTTMFYAREFAAISKHIEHEGVASGLGHLVANKASGVIGMVKQWATGVNWMDQEIRDPNSPWHQQVRDTVKATLIDLEPISMKSARESPGSAKDVALSIAGFSKAPRYVSQSDTEATISTLYRKYYAPKQTPYEAALVSTDRRQLAKLFEEGKVEEYGKLLDDMMTKYDLTASEQGRLARNIMKRGVDYNPYLTMFERLTWQQQKRLLDYMGEEERAEYLPRANREHLRFTYDEPASAETK